MQTDSLWNDKNPGLYRSGIWKQKKKNGAIIDVEIIIHDLVHENEAVMLILAIDITEKLRAEAELTKQADIQRKLIAQTSIQVQEKEREQIGKELHDNINQILAATKMYIDLAIHESAEEEVTEILFKSHKNINAAMEEIRQLSQSLVAPSLEGVSLDKALAKLIGDFPSASSLALTLDTTGYKGDVIDEDMKLTCYRIVQVQLSNIVKHAKAKKAAVRLRKDANLELTITDDGIGFQPGKNTSGIGLRNIRNRVGIYNGEVNISSEPGKGCVLAVTIPLVSPMKKK
jgi:two-component system sensor histidine kinase UhpB